MHILVHVLCMYVQVYLYIKAPDIMDFSLTSFLTVAILQLLKLLTWIKVTSLMLCQSEVNSMQIGAYWTSPAILSQLEVS